MECVGVGDVVLRPYEIDEAKVPVTQESTP